MLTDLQKAELYIKDKHFTFEQKSKKSDISISTLKKYVTLPQRLRNASWQNVSKLATLYDSEILQKNIDPIEIAKFLNWMDKNIPNDLYGERLRKIILNNKEILFQIIER